MGEGELDDFSLFLFVEAEEFEQPEEGVGGDECVFGEEGEHVGVGGVVELLFYQVDLYDVEQKGVESYDVSFFC